MDIGKSEGAKVLLGGGRADLGGELSGGYYVQPTIFEGTNDMRIFQEEIFGPVLAVTTFKTLEEAIAIANDTEYGLASSVFGRDVTRAMAIASQIESGICHINGPTVHDEAQMPFGGVKASGYGRFGGKAGIAEFTDLRWITVQGEEHIHYPL